MIVSLGDRNEVLNWAKTLFYTNGANTYGEHEHAKSEMIRILFGIIVNLVYVSPNQNASLTIIQSMDRDKRKEAFYSRIGYAFDPSEGFKKALGKYLALSFHDPTQEIQAVPNEAIDTFLKVGLSIDETDKNKYKDLRKILSDEAPEEAFFRALTPSVLLANAYMGYSWTKLPKVTKVEVSKSKELLRHLVNSGEIVCFDKLSITVRASDGKTFTSDVDMAMIFKELKDRHRWIDETVCVTKDARKHLSTENIWFHLGGYNEEGDSYDTQLYYFEKDLQELWDKLVGPYESLRSEIASLLSGHYSLCGKWQKITILEDRSLEILFKDCRIERVKPPTESAYWAKNKGGFSRCHSKRPILYI